MLKNSNYDLNYKGLFALTFAIEKNDKLCNDIRRLVYSFMRYIGTENEIDRIDQTLYSYVMNYYFNDIKLLPVSEQILHSDYMQQYLHRSTIKHIGQILDINTPDIKWVFNKQVKCLYLK